MYQFTDTASIKRLSDGAYIPADPDNDDYKSYLAWVAHGNTASPNPDAASRAFALYQYQAQALLDKSDVTVCRCVEHGVSVPAEWVAYRASLRGIVSATSGIPGSLPTKPAYPAGT